MRRLVVEEPIFLAKAVLKIAAFAFWSTLISIVILRFGLVEPPFGLAALVASLGLAFLAIIVAILAFGRIWRTGDPGTGRATAGFLLALALLAPPVGFLARDIGAPVLNDVTTDLVSPPRFTMAAGQRGFGTNPTDYNPANAPIQREAYPAIQPVLLELPPEDTFRLILRLAKERHWTVLVQLPFIMPAEGERAGNRDPVGRIEATDRSLLLGLTDDIAIRIRDEAGRTRVDMRSASRYGERDQGVNAARVAEFMEALRVNALIR
jgi:uncharacterized protein (DUF1499 family)